MSKAKDVPHRLAEQRGKSRVLKSRRCLAKTESGKQCGANPIRGKDRCLFHSGDNAVKLGSRGGHRRAVYSPEALVVFDPPKNASDLRDLLAQSIIEIRSGRLDPKLANSISYLGAGFLKAVELSDMEARLAALEQQRVGGTS